MVSTTEDRPKVSKNTREGAVTPEEAGGDQGGLPEGGDISNKA